MSAEGGYLFIVAEGSRLQSIKRSIRSGSGFTDAVPDAVWADHKREIALVSLDGERIQYAALVEKSQLVATSKRRIRFFELVDLGNVSFEELSTDGSALKTYGFLSSTGQGGWVPLDLWNQVVRVIKELRPQHADQLDELVGLRALSHLHFQAPYFATVREEKDATGLALEFAGLREQTTLRWHPQNEPAPFLRGLTKAQIREDTMIAHDANIFADWPEVRRYRVGAVQFANASQQVTIINVNRTPIEETLGTDLLYYHHQYRSFVLVQYKRMLGEASGSQSYRPNTDNAYQKEINRMRSFQHALPDSTGRDPVQQYRLHPGAFYFKLCPVTDFEPLSSALIEGMYLPLDYWQSLLDSNRAIGPRGGVAVTRENAGRHLNNTMFSYLVEHGWIGSRSEPTQKLEELVGELLSQGRSLLLADGRNCAVRATEPEGQASLFPVDSPQLKRKKK
jgi:hypothetical protein